MEVIDDLHDTFENIMSMPQRYEDKLQQFNDIDVFNQEMIQQALGEMPPERASALATALMDLPKLGPINEEDSKKVMEVFENFTQHIKTIRANLHAALDEKS